ncbi:MAG: PPC domain-containing protein [Planctomycetes bacterium]|nr:PPC domain-containing protein [Planctomycetota bacterium]
MNRLPLAFVATVVFTSLADPSRGQGSPEVEPNGGPASASTHVLGAQSYGTLSAGDVDCYRIFLPQAGDLRAWTAPGFAAQAGNTRLALLNHTGALLLEVDDGSVQTHGNYSLLERGALPAGTYFVRVRGFDGSTTGSYTLDVIVFPPGQLVQSSPNPVAVGEAPEPNDPRLPGGSATTGPLHATVSGSISSGAGGPIFVLSTADYDFYRVTVPAPGLLTFATGPGAAPAAADTVLHLCDAALQPIAIDDDGGPGFYSLLRYSVATPGVYYVAVSDYGTGNYRLDVAFDAVLASGPAIVLLRPGGCGPAGGVPVLETRTTSGAVAARPEKPILGSTFYLDLRNAPPNRLIARLYNLLPRTPALSLAAFGAPGCESEVDDPIVDFSTTDGNGVHFWALPLPADASFVGLPLEKQVAVLDPAFNALGVRVSNRVTAIVGIDP